MQPSTSGHVRMRLLEPMTLYEFRLKRQRIQLHTNPMSQPHRDQFGSTAKVHFPAVTEPVQRYA